MVIRWITLISIVILSSSCASTAGGKMATAPTETRQQEVQSIQSVVGALSGKPVTEQDLRKLSTDIKKDKDAQAALNAIASPMTQGAHVKYCPVDGKRFGGNLKTCPDHGGELKDVE